MTFNIHQLDNLTYDEVEPILEDYINAALDQFVNSPEGEVHTQTYPTGGGWIGSFIELAYTYDGVTLPKISKGDVQTLMEYTLPRKVTIFDASEAEDAIPELVAFWRFLQREYQFRSAAAIVKYLESLAPKFPTMMADPARGGFAKAFMIMGQKSGFDMTTQEGVQAFQQHYNESLKSDHPDPTTVALQNIIQAGMPSGLSSNSRPASQGMGTKKTTSAKKTTRKKPNRRKK